MKLPTRVQLPSPTTTPASSTPTSGTQSVATYPTGPAPGKRRAVR
jgi:hypothetical protein